MKKMKESEFNTETAEYRSFLLMTELRKYDLNTREANPVYRSPLNNCSKKELSELLTYITDENRFTEDDQGVLVILTEFLPLVEVSLKPKNIVNLIKIFYNYYSKEHKNINYFWNNLEKFKGTFLELQFLLNKLFSYAAYNEEKDAIFLTILGSIKNIELYLVSRKDLSVYLKSELKQIDYIPSDPQIRKMTKYLN